ncbi:MAG: hypothetical protein Q7W54_15020 [Bacteroidota bacterium]|nr:hypothetical protein [Bacteroidota bacterium]
MKTRPRNAPNKAISIFRTPASPASTSGGRRQGMEIGNQSNSAS